MSLSDHLNTAMAKMASQKEAIITDAVGADAVSLAASGRLTMHRNYGMPPESGTLMLDGKPIIEFYPFKIDESRTVNIHKITYSQPYRIIKPELDGQNAKAKGA